jgi:hypothetical protein
MGGTTADCRIERMLFWCLPGTLKYIEGEGDGFRGRIVMGDETCVHNHQPETKKVEKEWRHT